MTIEITIKEPSWFYGYKDEKYFFAWLKSIKAIEAFNGYAKGLKLTIRVPISDDDLRSLIALMTRYQLNLKPLSVLATAENTEWFKDPIKFWYQSVFGDTDPAPPKVPRPRRNLQ